MCRFSLFFVWFPAGSMPGLTLSSPAAGGDLTWDAGKLLQRSVTRHLDLGEDGDAIVLQRRVVYEDEGPAAGISESLAMPLSR